MLTKIDKQIIKLYKSGLAAPKIVKRLKIGIKYIYTILKKNNVSIREHYNRKYDVNDNFFDNINNEYKAYCLGILFADGYNNEKRNSVVLQLTEEDVDILKKINNLIQPTKPIQYIDRSNCKKFAHNAYRIVICSKHISQTLKQLGCKNHKTFDMVLPKINIKYIRHFIRGLFDGDGSIFVGKPRSSAFSIIGHIPFIKSIQKILMKKCSLSETKLDVDKRTHDIASLRYCGTNQLIRIRNYIYKNSNIYLERKFNKFMEIK